MIIKNKFGRIITVNQDELREDKLKHKIGIGDYIIHDMTLAIVVKLTVKKISIHYIKDYKYGTTISYDFFDTILQNPNK